MTANSGDISKSMPADLVCLYAH